MISRFDGKFYKFLSKEHVDYFLRGSLRLGGFDTYSLLEIITGDEWIGDRQESRAITRLDSLSGHGVYIRNSNLIMHSYGYCLSLSVGHLPKLIDAMANSKSPYRYDACIEIYDMNAFMNRLGKALETKYLNFRSMGFDGRPVNYVNSSNQFDASHFGDFHSHDPYSKPAKYCEQSEFRIAVIMDKQDQDHNYLTIDVGDISDIARTVSVPSTAAPWSSPFKLNEDQAKMSIVSILKALKSPGGEVAAFREKSIQDLIYAYGCLRFTGANEWRYGELEQFIVYHDIDMAIPMAERAVSVSLHGESIIRFLDDHIADFS